MNGRFEAGQSGNPAGRPKGTRSRATILAEKLMLAITQMAAGEVTPEEATTVIGILDAKRKAIELTEIDARIQALEAKTNQ